MQIIAAFHGTGKSYFTKRYNQEIFNILDLDTSDFSHKLDSSNVKVINPEFPSNFISTLINNSSHDLALIPVDKSVLNLLIEKNIEFEIIYPDVSLRSDYVLRYIERGSSDDFIRFIDAKFEKLIYEIETNYLSIKKTKLTSKNHFLSNVLF